MANSNNSQIEKLLELKQLFEAGVLTKEEMEAEKKKILGTNSEAPKESQETDVPLSHTTQKEQIEAFEQSESEAIETSDDTFFEKNKKYIFGGIALLFVVAGIFIIPKIISHSESVTIPSSDTKDVVQKEIILKGVIGDDIGFSMLLQRMGNEIEGTEHYESQKPDASISIKGTIDDNGVMTLYEYDGSAKAGSFNGNLGDTSYSGTFVNSRGKNFSFSAKVLTKKDLAKEDDAIKKIRNKGTFIALVDGKIYYIDKLNPETRYESEGDDCGKLYIYDFESGLTSSERILIPSGEMFSIEGYNYRDMKITFILYDVGRNGAGIGNYCTEVSQYNIKTGKWRAIAEGCAKAEFVDNNRKIKITTATVINSDAEYAYDYKYEYTDEIINL